MVSGNFKRPTHTSPVADRSAGVVGCCAWHRRCRRRRRTRHGTPHRSGDFNTGANWTPAAVPTGTAFFGT